MYMAPLSILIPHDGSPASGAVVDAVDPLVVPGTSITLLYVDEGARHRPHDLAAAEQRLTEAGATVSREDVSSTDPASAIVDFANESHPDLVAMSTHGQSGQHARTRGGVAERVLRSCSIPLYMANPFAQKRTRIASVLVPLEATSESAEILDPLMTIANPTNCRFTFLYVDFDDTTDSEAQQKERRAYRARDIEEWLAAPRKRAEAAGYEVEIDIAHGNPWEKILDATEAGEFDLLAMTTHARSGVSRWAFGSVAERVLRACRIPILVHRMGGS